MGGKNTTDRATHFSRSPGPSILASCWHHFGIILVSFWDLWASFWDHWAPLWDTWAPLWDTWATSCCMGGPCIEFIEFAGRFLTLWGSPFSPLGITISFPGVWNGENLLFCRQPDSRLDF